MHKSFGNSAAEAGYDNKGNYFRLSSIGLVKVARGCNIDASHDWRCVRRGLEAGAVDGGDAAQREGLPEDGQEAAEGAGHAAQEAPEGTAGCAESSVRCHREARQGKGVSQWSVARHHLA